MASMNNLIVSWNFDNLTSSSGVGEFVISDVSNDYHGGALDFDELSISKQPIKTLRKIIPETLESIDTIQILEEDDRKIDLLHKPSNLQFLVENSMYQVISDDMLNIFSSIDNYTFKFSRPELKYQPNYHELDITRHEYFSKVEEKPNLEKYLEFYKWIDSSLGSLITQLIPESSNNSNGLKNTIESHILERNKFKHKLPLTVETRQNHLSSIEVVKTTTGAVSNPKSYNIRTEKRSYLTNVSKSIDVLDENDLIGDNHKKNYEFIQTAGKKLNNRTGKENKTVFKTSFSPVDNLAYKNTDESGEYSIYNGLSNRARNKKQELNEQYKISGNLQNKDNLFFQSNVPNTDEQYHTSSNDIQHHRQYYIIPNSEILHRRYQNIIIDKQFYEYSSSKDVIEPAVQFNIPLKQNLSVINSFETIDVNSPYYNYLNVFNNTSLLRQDSILQNSLIEQLATPEPSQTFYVKSIANSSSFDFNKLEALNIIFPPNDQIGLLKVRSRIGYEEDVGSSNGNVWSEGSFNNNSTFIKSFWRSSIEDRKRKIGSINDSTHGSINNIGYESVFSTAYITDNNVSCSTLYRNSLWSMDSNIDIIVGNSDNDYPSLTYTNQIFGDLAPHPHPNLFLMSNIIKADSPYKHDIKVTPKASFIYNNFINLLPDEPESGGAIIFNKSYQDGIDCRIKPWYDNYEEFRQNIRHLSQTYSTVPEFIVSNYPDLIRHGKYNFIKEITERGLSAFYLTTNVANKISEVGEDRFVVKLNKFLDKKSNKIKINLKAVKKILPYNGFYPQQRTAQIAGLFSQDYLLNTNYIKNDIEPHPVQSHDLSQFSGQYPLETLQTIRAQTILQPLFAPGILFNTIKAGIAMPWNTFYARNLSDEELVDESVPSSCYQIGGLYRNIGNGVRENFYIDEVTGKGLMFIKKLDFETILNPEQYIKFTSNKTTFNNFTENPWIVDVVDNYLFYLDPSNTSTRIFNDSNELIKIPRFLKGISLKKFTEKIKGHNFILYKSSISNFLAETVNFFLKDSKLSEFKNKNNSTVSVQSGSVYTMDIVLRKSPNFSMFNKYSTSSHNYVPQESLFGPPSYIDGENIDRYGINAQERYSNNKYCYLPYAPPYTYNGESRMTLVYTASISGDVSIGTLVRGLKVLRDTLPPLDGTVNPQAYSNRVTVQDCVNYKIIDKDGYWNIKTKFEVPLINFSGCSTVLSGSYNNS